MIKTPVNERGGVSIFYVFGSLIIYDVKGCHHNFAGDAALGRGSGDLTWGGGG